ncbi:MAG: vitamin K epoxide reductase family protein [Bryobacteraceae bacterium]
MADLNVPAPPWDYNPSSWGRRIAIAVIASAAFFIAAYMALYQWRLIESAWDPIFGRQTEEVLDSDVSHWMWSLVYIPDAALGAFAYLGDAILGLAGSSRRWQYRPWLVALFALDVILVSLVSAILVVLQGTVVGAWCFLCLVTAALSLILIWLAWPEVWSCGVFLRRVWRRTRSARVMWDVFWGNYMREADEAALVR